MVSAKQANRNIQDPDLPVHAREKLSSGRRMTETAGILRKFHAASGRRIMKARKKKEKGERYEKRKGKKNRYRIRP